jgi:hypothetical protein
MCDFQYLPMEKEGGEGEGRLVSIYDQVNIDRLVTTSWLNTPAPLFIPPAVFSRMDVPQDYQVPNFFYRKVQIQISWIKLIWFCTFLKQNSFIFINSRLHINVRSSSEFILEN